VRYADIPRILTMSVVWLLLLVWSLNAHRFGCPVALGLVAALALILGIAGGEMSLIRRRVFIREYLEPGGYLYRAFGRRYLLIASEAFKSLFFAVFMIVSSIGFATSQWSVMFADVLVIGLLLPRFYGAFDGQVREEYRYAAARRLAMWVSVLLVWIESVISMFFSASENYTGLRWQEVIGYGASAPHVLCPPLADLVSIESSIRALGLWSTQNLARSINDLPQSLMASLGLLASVALAFLFAYAYSRALIGAVGRPWTAWRAPLRHEREAPNEQDRPSRT
jgi:hypothetical protein